MPPLLPGHPPHAGAARAQHRAILPCEFVSKFSSRSASWYSVGPEHWSWAIASGVLAVERLQRAGPGVVLLDDVAGLVVLVAQRHDRRDRGIPRSTSSSRCNAAISPGVTHDAAEAIQP